MTKNQHETSLNSKTTAPRAEARERRQRQIEITKGVALRVSHRSETGFEPLKLEIDANGDPDGYIGHVEGLRTTVQFELIDNRTSGESLVLNLTEGPRYKTRTQLGGLNEQVLEPGTIVRLQPTWLDNGEPVVIHGLLNFWLTIGGRAFWLGLSNFRWAKARLNENRKGSTS